LLKALGQALKISKDSSEYEVDIVVVYKKQKPLQVFLFGLLSRLSYVLAASNNSYFLSLGNSDE